MPRLFSWLLLLLPLLQSLQIPHHHRGILSLRRATLGSLSGSTRVPADAPASQPPPNANLWAKVRDKAKGLRGSGARITIVIALLIAIATRSGARSPKPQEVPWSEFLKAVRAGAGKGNPVLKGVITIAPTRVDFTSAATGLRYYARPVRVLSEPLTAALVSQGISFAARRPSGNVLALLGPLLYLGFLYAMMSRQLGGGIGAIGRLRKERAALLRPDQ